MACFALYAPKEGLHSDPERIVLVREHFSVWGFFLPLPYCLWHRNWRFSVLLILLGAAMGVVPATGLPFNDLTALGLELMAGLYVGLAAADIRTAALERRGFQMIDLAVAPDEEAALLRHLDHHSAAAQRPDPATAAAANQVSVAVVPTGTSAVLGLFPEAQR